MKPVLSILTFVAFVVISVIWHFPASGLWQQVQSSQDLPPNLQVTDLEGLWWQGSARLAWRQNGSEQGFGRWQWTWRPSALLSGKVGLDVIWTPVKRSVSAQVFWDGEHLVLEDVTGRLEVADFAGLVPNVGSLLADAIGQVVLNGLQAEINLNNQAWPKTIKGDVSIQNLQVLGVDISLLNIHPSMVKKRLQFQLTGGGDGWKLSGKTEVNSNHTYRSQLKIQAETAQTMPSWVSMVLPVKSPVLAESDQRGRW